MAYNRKNLLLKIIDIQKITLEHKAKGVTQQWIYNNIIRNQYRISLATFNNYLDINAKKEILKLDKPKDEIN